MALVVAGGLSVDIELLGAGFQAELLQLRMLDAAARLATLEAEVEAARTVLRALAALGNYLSPDETAAVIRKVA